MENDEVSGFLAEDPSIEAQFIRGRHRSDSASRHRRPGSGSSNGSSKPKPTTEETPLLSADSDGEQHSNAPGDNCDGDSLQNSAWDGYQDFEGLPWYKRPSVFWLIPPFAVFALAFGGILVPKINLILTLICRNYLEERAARDPNYSFLPVLDGADDPQCRIPEVQALVSEFQLYGNLIGGLLAAITSPKLGALSDRYGRIRTICCCASGALVNEVITIIVASYPDTFSVYLILLGFAADGVCGSFIAALALMNSYASDCTPPSRRNVTFGYFHASLFTGIAFGPTIGGFVTKKTDNLLTVFYIALVCHVLFLCYTLLVVPESLSKQRQHANRESHRQKSLDMASHSIDPALRPWLKALRNWQPFAPLRILWPTGPGTNSALRRNFVVLAALDTIIFGVAMGTMNIVVIYCEYVFGWGNFESSIYVSVVNICRVCILVVILPGITRLVRGPTSVRTSQKQTGSDRLDVWIIRIAILFDMLAYIGFSAARTGGIFLLSAVVGSIGGGGSPTLQSSLTKHTPLDQTGQLLGAIGLLHALARVVSPTILNLLYAQTVGGFTQTVFVCLACAFAMAHLLSWFLRAHVYYNASGSASSSSPSESSRNHSLERDQSGYDPVQEDSVSG